MNRNASRSAPTLVATSLVVALSTLAGTAQAAGTVQVNFVGTDQYSDAGRGAFDVERTTKALAEHLKTLGKALADGQVLNLTITDIDLAGELRPARNGSEVRVLRGRADWPRIDVNYTLTRADGTLTAGQAKISDMNYMYSNVGLSRGEAHAYENRMLHRWVQELVGTKTAAK